MRGASATLARAMERQNRRQARQREVAHLVRALRTRSHLTQEQLAYKAPGLPNASPAAKWTRDGGDQDAWRSTVGRRMRREREPEELVACWALIDADRGRIANKTGATRLGFALPIRYFELEGRFPRHADPVPARRAARRGAAQVGGQGVGGGPGARVRGGDRAGAGAIAPAVGRETWPKGDAIAR